MERCSRSRIVHTSEVFFRFAERCDIGEPGAREREFLGAIAIAVAVNPEPAFRLPPEWHRTDAGGFAVTTRGPRYLFAVARQGVIKGPITELVAQLLLYDDEPAQRVAARHGVTPAQLTDIVASLCQLGIRCQSGTNLST